MKQSCQGADICSPSGVVVVTFGGNSFGATPTRRECLVVALIGVMYKYMENCGGASSDVCESARTSEAAYTKGKRNDTPIAAR